MPAGIRYSTVYNHQRKEVTVILQVGPMPPTEYVMSAEAFIQDLYFIAKDKGMAKFIEVVRERKDLPVDHDFGAGGGGFNSKDWESKMGEGGAS